jgi:cobyrinic acid a,c-diamide synthase
VDVAGMSGTAAAVVLGCQQLEPGVDLRGVILNRTGSQPHARSTAEAIQAATGLPVLGSLPHDPRIAIPQRHLGLLPANERIIGAETLQHLARLADEHLDVEALRRIANSAPALPGQAPVIAPDQKHATRLAVAQDRAFGFYYQDTIDLLEEVGAEIVPFSPLDDEHLPASVGGVYIGGGFPEVFAADLARNAGMRIDVRAHAAAGRPLYAECGGLMALGQTLTTLDDQTLVMFGVLPLASRMQDQSLSIGYRQVRALRSSPLMPAGTRVRGHEFHWSVADAPPPDLAAYEVVDDGRLEGFCTGATLGSYVHLNLVGAPDLARNFVRAASLVA